MAVIALSTAVIALSTAVIALTSSIRPVSAGAWVAREMGRAPNRPASPGRGAPGRRS